MKKSYFLLTAFLLLVSCSKSSELPECLEDQIELEINDDIQKVYFQVVDNTKSFWLNTDAQAFDGCEAIVDENCNIICTLCGNGPLTRCDTLYRNANWELIWER